MKINFTGISIIILAISILVSSIFISNSLSDMAKSNSVSSVNSVSENSKIEMRLYSKSEIAEYMGITLSEFDGIDLNQVLLGSGIPFIRTDDDNYYTILGFKSGCQTMIHIQSMTIRILLIIEKDKRACGSFICSFYMEDYRLKKS
ncbi:hypothetical protein [Bacillus sp. SM2101]|uniref:hypothetical protein n=1 Tax=Bacillus sp. SM2101 TaxID=2805366 RepID=UPI001BDEC72E|nr:hypothetical protein [Bacillus sp. SM2101]